MTDDRLPLIQRLDAEFARVAAEQAPGSRSRRRGVVRGRWRGAALAAALSVLLGSVAAATTGVFTPHRESDGLLRLTEPTPLAAGTLDDGRTWRLFGSESDAGFCLELELQLRGAAGDGVVGAPRYGGCGGREPGGLHVASLAGSHARSDAVLYGTAPDAAASVSAASQDGVRATAAARDDSHGVPGRFFVLRLPERGRGAFDVEALDRHGAPIAATSHRR